MDTTTLPFKNLATEKKTLRCLLKLLKYTLIRITEVLHIKYSISVTRNYRCGAML